MKLDNFDKKILRAVQKDARLSVEKLSTEIGLSAPAVHRRLKKLRDTGVVEKEVAILSANKLGVDMTFIIQIEVERGVADLLDGFTREIIEHSEVQQLYYVTGDSDVIIIVKAKDMEEFEAFCQKAFYGNAKLRKLKTSVVLKNIKVGLEVPV